jgi:hypothetical protein
MIHFFLSGYLKGKLIDKQCATPKELSSGVEIIISEIPSTLIFRVFAIWQEGLQKCCDMRGNYRVFHPDMSISISEE